MKHVWNTKKGRVLVILLALCCVAGILWGGYAYWLYQQPKFQDVTIELGATSLGIDQFTTEYAQLRKCRFASDVSAIDIGKVGSYPITLSHGGKEETVFLHIQDTTLPSVEFIRCLEKPSGYTPDAMDFVSNFSDYSEVTAYFAQEPVLTEDYGDISVQLVVEDAWGNRTEQTCVLRTLWLREELIWEFDTHITKADLLLNPEKDSQLLDQSELDAINQSGIGQYTIVSSTAAKTMECHITVQDTLGPSLEVKDVRIYPGDHAILQNFVISCEDASGVSELILLTELDFETLGHQTVQIQATDTLGNVTTAEATLIVSTDMDAPVFTGLEELTVEKYGTPDYFAGVTAEDAIDGKCEVTCDFDNVDVTTAGTYYITYTAADKSGNVATVRRKVIVEHDQEDTAALVAEIAEQLENDPEKIRNYVRRMIAYNSNWGGDDPVWYGFKNRVGNCYVHALCLDALLQYYGYETHIIWVDDHSHYWVLIYLEGIGWRHIDATPADVHSIFSLMTDEQRLETLWGRTWDTSKWPAAE